MQNAYRRNRCTTDNLLKLTQHVTEAIQRSEMVGFVCLDIEKAFHAVWRLGLQNKLLQIGVHKPLIKWVNSFLSQRSIFVKINNSKSSTFLTLAGVPQGSVIAPILFLVYVSGIPEIPAQISQFADDFALYYRSRSCRIIQDKLQYSLDKWCEKLNIRINPGKTYFMLLKIPQKSFQFRHFYQWYKNRRRKFTQISWRKPYPTSKVEPTLQKLGGKSKQKNLPTMAAQSDQH